MRLFRKLTIPQHAHPLVRRLFEEMNKQQIGVVDLAERCSVNKNTISAWRKKSIPNIINIEACFSVLGMEVSLTKKREEC